MLHTIRVCALLLVWGAIASTGRTEKTQDNLSVHGDATGTIWLIQMDGVPKELGLTKAQADEVELLTADLKLDTRRVYAGLFGTQGPEYDRQLAKRRAQERELTEKYNLRVMELLEPRQIRRIEELYVRFLGPRALFTPAIVDRLKITPEQEAKLRKAVAEKKPTLKKLTALLTPTQQAQFTKLQGKPFAFPRLQVFMEFPDKPSRQKR